MLLARKEWGSNPTLGDVKVKHEPTEWLGITWQRDRSTRRLTVWMTKHIEDCVARHVPGILTGDRPSKAIGKGKVQAIFDKLKLPPQKERSFTLSAEQKEVQAIIGELKFPEPVNPIVSLPLHKLSCVMSYPPPGALLAAQLVTEMAWDARYNGITYGGEGVKKGSRVQADFHANLELDGAGDVAAFQPPVATLRSLLSRRGSRSGCLRRGQRRRRR